MFHFLVSQSPAKPWPLCSIALNDGQPKARKKGRMERMTYVTESPTLPPHWWKDMTAWTLSPVFLAISMSSMYPLKL
jgi:hypothetical protein